jgi:spermidine/putrescine transport system substrate-binding protein
MLRAEAIDVGDMGSFSRDNNIIISPIFYTSAELMHLRIAQDMKRNAVDVLLAQINNQLRLRDMYALQAMNTGLIPNLGFIDPALLRLCGLDNSGVNYMIPLVGGVMCLLVNKNLLDPQSVRGYADLWRPDLKGKILIPDDFFDLMPVVFKAMGESGANPTPEVMAAGWEKLIALADQSKIIANTSIDQYFEDGEIALALVYSVTAYNSMRSGLDLEVVVPEEGYAGWAEAVSIPAQSDNPLAAHAYVNFVLTPAVTAVICGNSGYSPFSPASYEILRETGAHPFLQTPQAMASILAACSLFPDKEYADRWRKYIEQKIY